MVGALYLYFDTLNSFWKINTLNSTTSDFNLVKSSTCQFFWKLRLAHRWLRITLTSIAEAIKLYESFKTSSAPHPYYSYKPYRSKKAIRVIVTWFLPSDGCWCCYLLPSAVCCCLLLLLVLPATACCFCPAITATALSSATSTWPHRTLANSAQL